MVRLTKSNITNRLGWMYKSLVGLMLLCFFSYDAMAQVHVPSLLRNPAIFCDNVSNPTDTYLVVARKNPLDYSNAIKIYWYDNPNGQEPNLSIGDTLQLSATRFLNEVSSKHYYYAFDVQVIPTPDSLVSFTADAVLNGTHQVDTVYTAKGMVFDAYTNLTIDTVSIFPYGPGTLTVSLIDSSGATLSQFNTSVPQTAANTFFQVPLKFSVQKGNSYKLVATGTVLPAGMRIDTTTFPVGDTKIRFDGPTINTNQFYYFYNWQVSYDNLIKSSGAEDSVYIFNQTLAPVPFQRTNCFGSRDTLDAGKDPDSSLTQTYAWNWSIGGQNFTSVNRTLVVDTGQFFLSVNYSLLSTQVCNITKTVTISQYPKIYIKVDSINNHACSNDTTDRIVLDARGGSGIYKIVWKDTMSNPIDSTNSTAGLQRTVTAPFGTYLFTVTDLNGCHKDTSLTLYKPQPLQLFITGLSVIDCKGYDAGLITDSVAGGPMDTNHTSLPLYKYAWSTVDGTGLVTSAANQNALSAGTYKLTVTDRNNCTVSDSATVRIRYGYDFIQNDVGFDHLVSHSDKVWSAVTVFDSINLNQFYDSSYINGLSIYIEPKDSGWVTTQLRIRKGVRIDPVAGVFTNLGETIYETDITDSNIVKNGFSCFTINNPIKLQQKEIYAVEAAMVPIGTSTNIIGADAAVVNGSKGAWLIDLNNPNGKLYSRGNWDLRMRLITAKVLGIDNISTSGGANTLVAVPNPFYDNTTIVVNMERSEKASLGIYNLMGQEVAKLANNQMMKEGNNEFGFNSRDLPAGIYMGVLQTSKGTSSYKIVLIK